MDKQSTGLNLKIPSDLSIRLSRRVLDLKESGATDVTKASLLIKYASRGLAMDQDGISEPINSKQSQ